AARRGIVGGTILDGEALVGVREERKGKRVLLRERRVPLWRVEARPEDGRVQLVEVADSITESDAFGRSAGGIGPRKEVEEHLLPAVVLERNPAAVMRGGGEVGRAIAGLQHGRLFAQRRGRGNHRTITALGRRRPRRVRSGAPSPRAAAAPGPRASRASPPSPRSG